MFLFGGWAAGAKHFQFVFEQMGNNEILVHPPTLQEKNTHKKKGLIGFYMAQILGIALRASIAVLEIKATALSMLTKLQQANKDKISARCVSYHEGLRGSF